MKELVSIARKTLESFFKNGGLRIKQDKRFQDKRGVFVTIHSYPDNELRGCIGFPNPEYPLFEAVQRAAVEAAFNDNRFSPLTESELNDVVFEVSVLTLPERIYGLNIEEKINKIEKYKDGLILENGLRRGLFLPQVWEDIQDKKRFLEALCWKAALTPDYIQDKNTNLYKFQVKAFKEVKPRGEIVEINLKRNE